MDHSELLTVKEAAKHLGCSVRHVRTLINKGILSAYREPMPYSKSMFYYLVEAEDVLNYSRRMITQGWPRGKTRKGS